eukprot:CAMPEP_0118701648 /NCGR_PEP_ID=MMETSP0800-20121206/17383_1 /TAXON_ID=210618 ORGANISM="Striatella unipunctata, Strain CCMP2910" /NCGR_SAMPLE_ID=MMETSP0800 /ASSEMBLY_ACC=CAM_ASM_000638 /LENGTH=248 /DNA_ID=CAMNT_0006602623 /DNA_START=20 /DNA_END=767 /DNA_ORIENTATION=-
MKQSVYSKLQPSDDGDAVFHADIGKTLYVIGVVEFEDENASEAISRLKEAEETSEIINSPEVEQQVKASLLMVLEEQAMIHRQGMKHESALETYSAISAEFPDISQTMEHQFHIADCLTGSGQFQAALNHYRKMLEADEELSLSRQAQLHHRIGVCLTNQQNFQDALDELQLAVNLYRQIDGEFDYEVGRILNCIGIVYSRLGEKMQAKSSFQEALLIFRVNAETREDENPEVLNTLQHLSALEKESG